MDIGPGELVILGLVLLLVFGGSKIPTLARNLGQAKTEFEKLAEEKIKGGAAYFEQVVENGGKRRLLAATVVPAVHQRCAKCHGVNEGDLLGFLRYEVPIK